MGSETGEGVEGLGGDHREAIIIAPGQLQFTTAALTETTQEVDPKQPRVIALGRAIAAKAILLKAAVLTANQFGLTDRVAYVNLQTDDRKIGGPVFNLSVTPLTEPGQTFEKKAFKAYGMGTKKLLVTRYPKVEVGFHATQGDWRTYTVDGEPWSVMWYAAEMLLNGVSEWVERDYQTVRRTEPKVKPNDLCPCGSGRKYKRCCGPTGGFTPRTQESVIKPATWTGE